MINQDQVLDALQIGFDSLSEKRLDANSQPGNDVFDVRAQPDDEAFDRDGRGGPRRPSPEECQGDRGGEEGRERRSTKNGFSPSLLFCSL